MSPGKLLREPLVHFLIGALCVFLFYWAMDLDRNPEDYVITVSDQQINVMLARFEQSFGRAPRGDELDKLISNTIDEEIYYREALRLGLDDNDPVIRRRLATKMRYLHTDAVNNQTPTEAELQQWLSAHAKDYAVPAQYDLEQIYLGQTIAVSEQALASEIDKLNKNLSDGAAFSHPLSIPARFNQTSATEIARLFGSAFAATLALKPTGQWTGPIASGYGFHLVKIDRKSSEKSARFEDVRKQLINDYQSAKRSQAQRDALDALRSEYDIRVPSLP